ncbi:MAG: hypothetical protein DRG78_15070 [Epsilonproteobacteria bacterium]|nr:MAG: hypothetical protein DRG78_15070 [Campylobacterota bacterium]
MASFEQHVNGAVIATGVVIAPLNSASLIDTTQSFIVLGLGLIGGVLPDLDSDNSRPIQIVFKIFSIFFPLIVILGLFNNLSIVYLVGYWLISTFILRITLFKLFISFTTHRGIFHTIPMGIVFGQITTLIFYTSFNFDIVFSTIAGSFLFFGFIVHLLLDELVSLNALGIKVKRSFGTAFKLYAKNNLLATFLLYLFILGFFFLMPINFDIFVQIIDVMGDVEFL